jgi:hypothetical protein
MSVERFPAAFGAALALAATCFVAPFAAAAGNTATPGPIRLAQADGAPMVITPHPQQGQMPPASAYDPGGPGVPYQPAPGGSVPPPSAGAYVPPPESRGTFSVEEIKEAGHHFFGSISMGLASVIEYSFQRAGRPNGYILGEGAGGAVIAGVRYGEGTLYTKDAGERRFRRRGLQDHGPGL